MISKLKLVVATAVLAVGGLSGFALANGHMGGRKALVEKFDANKDGKLDDAEKAKLVEARKAMREERIAERFAEMDANKDGSVTLEEMKAAKHDNKMHGRHRRHGGPRDQK
jgi:hypothetical protein